MSTLDTLERIERELTALRQLEEVRAQKLLAEKLALERGLLLANTLNVLRHAAGTNGTAADDVRRQREIIRRHLKDTAAA